MSSIPDVSVIVPTRNAGGNLRLLIEALAQQSFPRQSFEVLIADDGSTDGSTKNLDGKGLDLHILAGPPVNAPSARNRAVSVARGSVLAFCDSDCQPEPQWLTNGYARLEQAELVAGQIRLILPERLTLWALLDLDHALDQEMFVHWGCAATANLFIRRELFQQIGGLDASLPTGDDFDLVQRCVVDGARLMYAPDVVVRHPTRHTATAWLRKQWLVNQWGAVRMARAGWRPYRLTPWRWLPLADLVWERRWGLPGGLNRSRIESYGIRPTIRQKVIALAAKYLFVPYVCGLAEIYGWRNGRHLHDSTISREAGVSVPGRDR